MDITRSAEGQAFREEVRTFIADNLSPATAAKVARGDHLTKQDHLDWEHALARRGWLAYSWPAEQGGPGWSVLQQFIFQDVMAEMNAPTITPFGVKMLGPILHAFGSDEQKRRHLPGILNSTTWWCQGYSEPQAGSDLASLRTKAERHGDAYVVNGQKIWTSSAHFADWIFALVRTSREEKRQDGISFLLIDMTSPGIEVRPIISMNGWHGFNEVFFKDVEVPADNLIGTAGKGWTYAKYLLSHERLDVVGLPELKRSMKELRAAADYAPPGGRRMRDDPAFRAKLVDCEVRLKAIELRVVDMLGEIMDGGSPGNEVSGLKIRGTELTQDIMELMMEAGGYQALPLDFSTGMGPEQRLASSPPFSAGATSAYLYRRAWTILGGSNEIQKNIMSKAVLGL